MLVSLCITRKDEKIYHTKYPCWNVDGERRIQVYDWSVSFRVRRVPFSPTATLQIVFRSHTEIDFLIACVPM